MSILIFVVKPTDSQYFLDPNGAAEVHSFAFLQLVVIQYISFVASYIEMPERYYPKYWRGFMAFFGLANCVFTIAAAIQLTAYDPELEMNLRTGMFVQHEVALDALCGATCVTTQGFPCIVNCELDLADMGIVFIELSGDGCI